MRHPPTAYALIFQDALFYSPKSYGKGVISTNRTSCKDQYQIQNTGRGHMCQRDSNMIAPIGQDKYWRQIQ